jgi:tetratricopeptide (TPR) repeat protein
MRLLNIKIAGVDFLRYFIVVVTLIAWGGALAQTTAEDYFNRGNALLEKGDYDQAIADYTQALSINPQATEAYYNRGTAWYFKGDYDRAIADYNQALRINPQNAAAHYNRGLAWQSKGDYNLAARVSL